MTAPTVDAQQDADLERPDGTAPIRLVLCVEGIETGDRRYIEPGALSTRPMPLGLYAQVKSTHGLDGDAATYTVGAITEATRVPGPQVSRLSTGEPFPEGTFVWIGRGWMYTDVPTPESGNKPAFVLVKDGALRGNSVDMISVDAEFMYDDDEPMGDAPPRRIVIHSGVIGSTTLVGVPAFMDAFVELDGEVLTPDPEMVTAAITAGATPVPSWRAAEVGDACGPCAAGVELLADTDSLADMFTGEDLDPPDLDFSRAGMVALIPANPNILAAPGGMPSQDLHLTLAYLGDQVTDWDPHMVAALRDELRAISDRTFELARREQQAVERGETPTPLDPDVAAYRGPGQRGPLTMNVFSHAVFNPNGDNGHDPATVYLFDGGAERDMVDQLAMDVRHRVSSLIGDALFPTQHEPFVPHVTAGYNLPVDQLTYTGPIVFDRLRLALGTQVTDYTLTGGDGPSLTAAAAPLPPLSWFEDPKLTEQTPITVTEDGRVFGHMACWGTCHTGFTGICRTPPRSATGYAYFQVHATRAVDEDGTVHTVPVGYGSLSRSQSSGGHPDSGLSAYEAAAHYDNTCTAVFELAAGEDDFGIWVAGRLMPGLDEVTEHQARGIALSGDWRMVRGNLELVAALGVNSPGFPVLRTRVVGGTPVAMVAAGFIHSVDKPVGEPSPEATLPAEVRQVLEYVARRATEDTTAGLRAELDELLPDPDLVAAQLHAEVLLALDAEHPWYLADDDGQIELADGPGAFKVLHLPPFIKRIANHLQRKGMSKSHAIAAAKNAADKMCTTGDLNFPGSQQVNPGSRAEACKASAQWKKDRPGAR